ncbi:hypothetical protein K466DRAFT_569464 [Polyporus arcularius HHB13444]|uniref:ATP-dependent DNA helicase n=1 Tax=Polyporus arcularius HHB13444 TaxID=1314778 RepID=A0A5C3NTA3_9APHY|nr:hypothetical protein K466DRAFT_569464 [Polyporus arcularius HHB13444]
MNQAILHLFTLLGWQNKILVSAPMGAAAVLIGGYTIHSLLLLPNEDNPDLQTLAVIWENIIYLIIDKLSMHAKGWSALAEDQPFGGVNVIFLGDFGQLRPVHQRADCPGHPAQVYVGCLEGGDVAEQPATEQGRTILEYAKPHPRRSQQARTVPGNRVQLLCTAEAADPELCRANMLTLHQCPCDHWTEVNTRHLNCVNVISVPSCNPVAALKHFWASLIINFLQPNLAVCSIPLTTLECVGILKPVMTTKDEKATDKYGIRGFELLVDPSLPMNNLARTPSGFIPHPHQPRMGVGGLMATSCRTCLNPAPTKEVLRVPPHHFGIRPSPLTQLLVQNPQRPTPDPGHIMCFSNYLPPMAAAISPRRLEDGGCYFIPSSMPLLG